MCCLLQAKDRKLTNLVSIKQIFQNIDRIQNYLKKLHGAATYSSATRHLFCRKASIDGLFRSLQFEMLQIEVNKKKKKILCHCLKRRAKNFDLESMNMQTAVVGKFGRIITSVKGNTREKVYGKTRRSYEWWKSDVDNSSAVRRTEEQHTTAGNNTSLSGREKHILDLKPSFVSPWRYTGKCRHDLTANIYN